MKKAIGLIAVVLVVVLVGAVGWLVWGSWVSPVERWAMRDALDRIDEVAKFEGNEQADYSQRLQAAEAAILICHKREVTAYDKQLVPVLDLQFDGAKAEHAAGFEAIKDSLYARKLKVLEDSNRQTEAMLRAHLQ